MWAEFQLLFDKQRIHFKKFTSSSKNGHWASGFLTTFPNSRVKNMNLDHAVQYITKLILNI